MRFGVCGGPERFEAMHDAGADYVEPPVAYYAEPEAPDTVWRERLARLSGSGLTAEAWNCMLPGDLKVVGPQADGPAFSDRLHRYIEVAVARLHEAGARVVVFGSGASRTIPPDFPEERAREQFLAVLDFVADTAALAGITVAVEPLRRAETNLLNTVTEAAALVREGQRPNIALNPDQWHMEIEGEPAAALRDVPTTIGHAHVADTDRRPPGTGEMNLRWFLAALDAAGYDGRVSIEANWSDFESEVAPALRTLRDAWADISHG